MNPRPKAYESSALPLSYPAVENGRKFFVVQKISGAPGLNRTSISRLRSPALYPLSYGGDLGTVPSSDLRESNTIWCYSQLIVYVLGVRVKDC